MARYFEYVNLLYSRIEPYSDCFDKNLLYFRMTVDCYIKISQNTYKLCINQDNSELNTQAYENKLYIKE